MMRYLSPPHHENVPDLLSDLEKFWHSKSIALPILIKVAISHYQFETIHPFLDGNGRIGRLIITLQLIDAHILDKPVLYLSRFLEKNKASYYDALTLVRESNKLEYWVKFFLNGLIETANNGKDTLEKIIEFRETINLKIMELGGKKSKYASSLINKMYTQPIMNAKDALGHSGLSSATSINALLRDLEKLEIIHEITGHSRNRLYSLEEYINLFRY